MLNTILFWKKYLSKNENLDANLKETLVQISQIRFIWVNKLKSISRGAYCHLPRYYWRMHHQILQFAIHKLRQQNVGLFLTHYLIINTLVNVSKICNFLDPHTYSHSPFFYVINEWSLRAIFKLRKDIGVGGPENGNFP